MYDWNGNGKSDFFDSSIDYSLMNGTSRSANCGTRNTMSRGTKKRVKKQTSENEDLAFAMFILLVLGAISETLGVLFLMGYIFYKIAS